MIAKDEIRDHVEIHVVVEGSEKGWVHTYGLDVLGFPELEIRDCPMFLCNDAAGLLMHIAEYMYDDRVVIEAGQTMGVNPNRSFRLVHPAPCRDKEAEFHYESPRLQVAEVDMQCACCRREVS